MILVVPPEYIGIGPRLESKLISVVIKSLRNAPLNLLPRLVTITTIQRKLILSRRLQYVYSSFLVLKCSSHAIPVIPLTTCNPLVALGLLTVASSV